MLAFIARRLLISAALLLAGTFIAYVLIALSGDPLADLRQDPNPGVELRIQARIDQLDLDTPVPLRFLGWLSGAAGCLVPFALECDLGQSVRGQEVTNLLTGAIGSTLQLITVATLAAAVIGVAIGIVTALRQYSRLDYSVTLASFVFVSLPIFWVAVLLKQYIAIDLNDWLADPTVSIPAAVVAGVASGLVWGAIIGGSRRQVVTTFAVAAVTTAAVLLLLSVTGWFADPGLGPVMGTLMALGAAVAVTAVVAGFRYRNVLYAAVATALVGSAANVVLGPVLADPSWLSLLGLLLLSLAVAAGIGYGFGGLQRRQAITAAAWTAVLTGGVIVVDRLLRAWDGYFDSVGGRVIATFGSRTPNYDEGFWPNLLDTATHLILPTMALILVSLAVYSRYTRSSMLEVLNQDYVRTARSKGATEQTVIVRHAFRNGLIPITTLMAFDFAGLIGGAVITETVFGWQGMGKLFTDSLRAVDPNPAMAFFLITGTATVVFNMLADIAYAYLDPRIRIS